LEIIGEASNKIAPDLKSKYPIVPWREMSDLYPSEPPLQFLNYFKWELQTFGNLPIRQQSDFLQPTSRFQLFGIGFSSFFCLPPFIKRISFFLKKRCCFQHSYLQM